MKIAILSDTHKKFSLAKEMIDLLVDNGAEYIVHAGDICQYETLEYIAKTKLPYVVVYGNNDAHMFRYHNDFNLVQEPYYFVQDGVRFKLMHMPYYLTPDSDVVIYGHTHIFELKQVGGTLFVNSGEVCARERLKSTAVLLETTSKQYRVQQFVRDLRENKVEVMRYEFER